MVSQLLTPEGVCLVRVPTSSSYAWQHYRTHWWQLDAPRHFFLHSIRSIEILTSRAAMCVENIIFDSTELQFMASEQYRRGIPLLSRESAFGGTGSHRFSNEQLRAFKQKANEFNEQRIGDLAAFYLRKNSAGNLNTMKPCSPRIHA